MWPFVCAAFLCGTPAATAVTLTLPDNPASPVAASSVAGTEAWKPLGSLIAGTVFERAMPSTRIGQFSLRFQMPDDETAEPAMREQKSGARAPVRIIHEFDPYVRAHDFTAAAEEGFHLFSLPLKPSRPRAINHLSMDMFGIRMGGITTPPLPVAPTRAGSPVEFMTAADAAIHAGTSIQSDPDGAPRFISKRPSERRRKERRRFYDRGGDESMNATGLMNVGRYTSPLALQNLQVSPIPEPGTGTLAFLAGILAVARRRRDS